MSCTEIQIINKKILLLLCAVAVFIPCLALAITFELTPGSDIVGKVQYTKVYNGENLADVSRRFKIGAKEVMDANPKVAPWRPRIGSKIKIPSQFILPSGPRKGIVVNLPEMRLYYFHPDGKHVTTYPVGIGKTGWSTPVGRTSIIQKKRNPHWVVPPSILADKKARGISHPKVVPPGPDNPLGKHAMRLGLPGYLIHGTNRNKGIGLRVSHGCIRMHPQAISELFSKVPVGTPVRIVHEPYKFGYKNGKLYLESHPPLKDREFSAYQGFNELKKKLSKKVQNTKLVNNTKWRKIKGAAVRSTGIPTRIW